jgi:hypothetical protein
MSYQIPALLTNAVRVQTSGTIVGHDFAAPCADYSHNHRKILSSIDASKIAATNPRTKSQKLSSLIKPPPKMP